MILKNKASAFTLIEIMVAMVVLAIGLLGMAAMTMMVVRGTRGASDLTAATNICQLKLEELKDIQWTCLGNGTTPPASCGAASPTTYGLEGGGIVLETELNSRGKTIGAETAASGSAATAASLGPYHYARSFVVCQGKDYTAGTPSTPPSGSDQPLPGTITGLTDCKVDPGNPTQTRSQWLRCLPEDITGTPGTTSGVDNPEKKIKVLCTWNSREGMCHSVHLETTAVQLGTQ